MKWGWLFGEVGARVAPTKLAFYNTLSKSKEPFNLPPYASHVRMYSCGPTVYDVSHIGNLRAFVFPDIVRRVLEYNAFSVKQVINITDFGHLSSDADAGDDKMTKGLKRDGLEPTLENMLEMGRKYAGIFKNDLRALNVDVEHISFPHASEYIPAQIALVKTLEEKGYAYRVKSGVYFDTRKFADYGKLGDINLEGQQSGARVETEPEKRSPTDFVLWKADAKMGWDSPWGKGFPGWHIECSAMIHSILGKQIDIHTGGVDLVPIHHNNEIAQSETATGKKPFSRFWLHNAFLNLQGEKIAKSVGNIINLKELQEKGFHPLAFRYLLLGAHYRTPSNFTWEALEAAQNAFLKLRRFIDVEGEGKVAEEWQKKIREHFNDDLDTPGALATMWDMTKDSTLAREDVKATILDADKVFGLGLAAPDPRAKELAEKSFGALVAASDLPEKIMKLVDERENARADKNWTKADELRTSIEKEGYTIKDGAGAPKVYRK